MTITSLGAFGSKSRYNSVRSVKKLLEEGLPVNATRPISGYALLHIAAQYGNEELAKLLLEKGADINIKNKDGDTPLIIATIYGNIEVAKLLLNKGADINAKDNEGNTALNFALALRRNAGMLEFLLKKGADVNAKDNKDRTTLRLAYLLNRKEAIPLLESYGAKQ